MFTIDEIIDQIDYPRSADNRSFGTTAVVDRSPVLPNKILGVSSCQTYCPDCSKGRFFKIEIIKGAGTLTRLCREKANLRRNHSSPDEWGPSLLQFTCENCGLIINSMICDRQDGPSLLSFPNRRGGLSTPHTPKSIAYFLDQAYKCISVGASGAAVAMFRVALEQLLHEQGYKTGMLASKIQQMDADVTSGVGPDWAVDLDKDVMTSIRKLGNVVVHPKTAQELRKLDSEVLEGTVELFQHLLADVYERPKADQKFLSKLKKMRSEL